jgi:hypothetical protein
MRSSEIAVVPSLVNIGALLNREQLESIMTQERGLMRGLCKAPPADV